MRPTQLCFGTTEGAFGEIRTHFSGKGQSGKGVAKRKKRAPQAFSQFFDYQKHTRRDSNPKPPDP